MDAANGVGVLVVTFQQVMGYGVLLLLSILAPRVGCTFLFWMFSFIPPYIYFSWCLRKAHKVSPFEGQIYSRGGRPTITSRP